MGADGIIHSGELVKVRGGLLAAKPAVAFASPNPALDKGVALCVVGVIVKKLLTLLPAHTHSLSLPLPQAPPLGTGIMSSIKSWKKRFFILREVTKGDGTRNVPSCRAFFVMAMRGKNTCVREKGRAHSCRWRRIAQLTNSQHTAHRVGQHWPGSVGRG